jgi:hypothetical protein
LKPRPVKLGTSALDHSRPSLGRRHHAGYRAKAACPMTIRAI